MLSTKTLCRPTSVFVSIIAAGVFGGCGVVDGSDEARSSTTAADSNGGAVIKASRTKLYVSVEALAKDAQGVAMVSIEPGTKKTMPADLAGTTPITATVVTGQVVETLHGKVPDSVEIRLITSSNAKSEVPPALVEGATYVLFLTPFEWKVGEPTGQWTVPGGAGIYRLAESGRLELASRGFDDLPADYASLSQLKQAVEGQSPTRSP